jgi:DNA polymerase V
MYVHVVAVPNLSTSYACLVCLVPVSAGYPSPADDYLDGSLDLNQHLIKHHCR